MPPHELFVKEDRADVEARGARDGEELIAPSCDADNEDPSKRIAGFKATRAASQRRALGVLLSFFLVTVPTLEHTNRSLIAQFTPD